MPIDDKFLPSEGLNQTFVDIVNAEVITRPSETGVQHPLLFLKKRSGLYTKSIGGVDSRKLDGDIGGSSYFNNTIYLYSTNGSLYSFDGGDITSLKTGLQYNGTDYLQKAINVSFVGGGRYPDQHTVFTVNSYNNTTAVITINETLTAQQMLALPGKYIYVKSSTGAQRCYKAVDTVPTNQTIKLSGAGFAANPVSGDTLFIYNKFITQTLYPQLREGGLLTYKFFVNATMTTVPTVGAVYTHNSLTYTLVSSDVSVGKKGTLVFSGTGNPLLSGTLTKSSGTGDATITFFDSDNGMDRLTSRDTDGNLNYLYFPNDKKIIKRDNRLMGLHKNQQFILPHDQSDIEIITTAKMVPLGSSQGLNIDVFTGYLVVFFSDRIGIIKKTIDSTGADYVYTYQDILSFGLYSEESYIIYGGNFYVYANDKRLYAINFTAASGGDVIATPEDQGGLLVNYFSKISDGVVKFNYIGGELRMVHVGDAGTNVYKYVETYKCRIRDIYTQHGNFMSFIYNIGDEKYTCNNDTIYQLTGIQDISSNIDMIIKGFGPVQTFAQYFSLEMFRLRLGFNGVDTIGGTITCNIGGYVKYNIVKNLSKLSIIDELNNHTIGAGTMGGNIMGDVLFGGESGLGHNLLDYYSEYLDIGIKIGKQGSRYEFIIENNENSQTIFGGIVPVYRSQSTEFIPNKMVL